MPLLFANDLHLNGHKVTNMADGTASSDGATKGQLDTASTNDRARGNHTGTQLASTISDFTSAVQAIRWQTLLAPNADVNMGSQKLTNVATPTTATDAATKGYVDTAVAGVVGGTTLKGAVEVVHTANVNIANPGTATFDGVTISTGQIVLLAGQTTGSQNGPYVFNGSGAAMTRAGNWDTAGEAVVGSFWSVNRGTRAEQFALMTNDTFTLGTDTAAFTYFNPLGGADNDSSFAQNVGTGAAGPYTITHSLGTVDVTVTVRELSTGYLKLVAWRPTSGTNVNSIDLEPDETWATNSHRVTVEKVV